MAASRHGRAAFDRTGPDPGDHLPGDCPPRIPPRRRLRLRHQAQHPAAARRARLRRHGRAGRDAGRQAVSRSLPTGVFLCNGPGDPAAVAYAIAKVRDAAGPACRSSASASATRSSASRSAASTYKLKFGHRGGNQPVRDCATGRVEISAQNHGFAVDPRLAARPGVAVTHVNLNDGCCEGLAAPDAARLLRCSTTRRAAPARTTPTALRPLRRADAHRPGGGPCPRRDGRSHDPDPGLRPDRHRPGLRVRLLRHAGVQGAAARWATASCWSTPTPPRS